jgi:foldase protein PrsA
LACVTTGLAAAVGCGGPAGSGPVGSASPRADDEAVARVDGVEVKRSDVSAIIAEARLEGRSVSATAARQEAIRRELVRRQADRLGISVPDPAVEARLAAVRERAGGATALAAALARAEMTPAAFRSSIVYGLLEEKLAAAQFASPTASPQAVRDFYERHRIDLFTTPAAVSLGDITLPSRRLAVEVIGRLARGGDFAAVARQYSMDKATKENGGKLGWISLPSLPAELRAAVAGVAPGDVSAPVQSFVRRATEVRPFAVARPAIAEELTRRRRAAALDDWLAKAVKRARVEMLP